VTPRSSRLRIAHPLACALVALATLAAFLPALGNGFLDWDDRHNLVDNPHYRGFEWDHLRWMFTTNHLGHYIPLTWMTFALDYVLWGMNPAGYHLTNLLLHAANAAVVYGIALQIIALARPAKQDEAGSLVAGAIFTALFFALHPLRVESVAWVTERRDLLSGLFYLLAILAYLHYASGATAAHRSLLWASLASFTLALLSKSMAVSLPAVLLILDVYPLRRLPWPSRAWLARPARGVLLEKVPFVLLALAASATALLALSGTANMTPLVAVGALDRVAISLFSLAFYLWKTVAPLDLSPLYELPGQIDPWSWPFVLSAAVVLAITALALCLRRSRPVLLGVWLAYVVILLPVVGIVHNGLQIAADRYTYLACVAWALALGGVLARYWRVRASLAAVLATVVTVALGLLTWSQVQAWRSSETLWTHALKTHPSSVAHLNLGWALAENGETAAAVEHYREALRIRPRYAEAHNNLGLALAAQGNLPAARLSYQEALKLNPRLVASHVNLGVLLAELGDTDAAIAHYREALRIRPAYPEGHANLAQTLERRGQVDEAFRHFVEAVRLRPDSAEAHNNLGAFLARRGQLDPAVAHFTEAVQLKPGFAEAHNNFGIALAQQGQLAAAAEHFREAVSLKPAFQEARSNLDRALRELGQAREQ
jgi:protein O-mannosyl-transferase